jgi:sensor histidine kinase YesM
MAQHPFIFSHERKYRLQRHLAFWIFWWLFFAVLYSYTFQVSILPDFKRLPVALVDSLFYLFPHMLLTYSIMYYVIPWFVFTGKYLRAAAIVLFFFFVVAFISAVIGSYILPVVRHYLFNISPLHASGGFFLLALLAGLRGAITIGGLAAAIKLMKYWYVKEQRNLQLQKENIEAQLQLLKAQVQPHFLFNTLNNIYSHTQTTSPVAANMVAGLSDLMRYILYEATLPLVSLDKELNMLHDYIDLEKMRYGNKLEMHVDMPTQTYGLNIAPLLLLPLVENSFKHGASNMLEQPWINLKVAIENNVVEMKLVNGKAKEAEKNYCDSGLGIKNVQKRLALLYPSRHELKILNEEDTFIVTLKVELEPRVGTLNPSFQKLVHA